jgi:hypothetical protein
VPSAARPSPWTHATGARSRQSHRLTYAFSRTRGNRRVAYALRFVPVRSFGFTVPRRKRVVNWEGRSAAGEMLVFARLLLMPVRVSMSTKIASVRR